MWDGLALGDWVYFYGNVTNFAQPIDSMQIDHQPLEEFFAEEGQEVEIAIKVVERVRAGDYIYAYYPDDDHTG